jgi:hypothetical protein
MSDQQAEKVPYEAGATPYEPSATHEEGGEYTKEKLATDGPGIGDRRASVVEAADVYGNAAEAEELGYVTRG